jgi:hypothetical protein
VSGAFTSTSRRALTIGAVLVASAAILLLIPVLGLWNADLSVPFASVYERPGGYAYARDAPFYLMLVKGGIDNLWYFSNPSLGWPLGQQIHDLPHSLDNLNLAVLKVLGLVFGDVATTTNVFFVLTFAGVAVSAFLVLRKLRVSAPSSFVAALLYAYLPYHFARGVPHLLLSAYWVVPIAVYLVLRVVSDRPPFTTPDPDARWGFRVRVLDLGGILWLLACAAIASTGSYYAVLGALLLAVVLVVDLVANRRVQVLVSGGVALAVIVIVAFVNLLPSFVYWAEHGSNDALFRRLPYETEAEGLKVSQLFLPIEDHRIEALAETQADSARFSPVPSEKGQQLGMVGALGLLGVLGALLLAARRRSSGAAAVEPERAVLADDVEARAPPTPDDGLDRRSVLRTLGVMAAAAILLATVSGVSLLISGVGFRDIRAWNRIVVFIGFAAFVAVAYALDWIGQRLPDRAWRVPVVVVGLVSVLLIGVLDQVSPASIPDYGETKARWESDAAFVDRLERTLQRGSRAVTSRSSTPAVFQLPYQYFPEAPSAGFLGSLGPYDLVRGYLHSDDLDWGWGGVRGRGADWQLNTAAAPTDEFLDRITAVGFSGLTFDRAASYAGGGPSEAALTEELGKPVVSGNRELVFWDLRDRAQDLRERLGAKGVARLRAEALADVPEVRAQGS